VDAAAAPAAVGCALGGAGIAFSGCAVSGAGSRLRTATHPLRLCGKM